MVYMPWVMISFFCSFQENSEWNEWQTTVLQERNIVENVYRWACGYAFSLILLQWLLTKWDGCRLLLLYHKSYSQWLKLEEKIHAFYDCALLRSQEVDKVYKVQYDREVCYLPAFDIDFSRLDVCVCWLLFDLFCYCRAFFFLCLQISLGSTGVQFWEW